jgi:hypothetical protein
MDHDSADVSLQQKKGVYLLQYLPLQKYLHVVGGLLHEAEECTTVAVWLPKIPHDPQTQPHAPTPMRPFSNLSNGQRVEGRVQTPDSRTPVGLWDQRELNRCVNGKADGQ